MSHRKVPKPTSFQTQLLEFIESCQQYHGRTLGKNTASVRFLARLGEDKNFPQRVSWWRKNTIYSIAPENYVTLSRIDPEKRKPHELRCDLEGRGSVRDFTQSELLDMLVTLTNVA